MKVFIQRLGHGLLIAGLLLLSYPVASWVYSESFQIYQNWNFDRDRAESPRQTQPHVIPHAVMGRLEIPRLDLSVMIVEGVEKTDLLRGAGHVPGTALPGESGNIALAAHRDTFFRPLQNIRSGDIILLSTVHGSHRYQVEDSKVTVPTDLGVLESSPRPILTLITCYPFSYLGSAPERFVVRARLVDPLPESLPDKVTRNDSDSSPAVSVVR